MGRARFFKSKIRRRMSNIKRGLFFCVTIVILLLVSSYTVFALEPPDPGEIEYLKLTGEYAQRVNQAKILGNHLIDPFLLEQALYKVQREAFIQKGLPLDEISPEPPPARKLMPTKGNVKIFALLIDFTDYTACNTQAGIHNALFGDGSVLGNPVPYESLKNYYERSSYNQLHLSGITLGWYHAPYERSEVVMTTQGREALIKEAIAPFDGTTDFTQFDNDGNGQIEYFIVIWTGPDNGWANFWWGYQTNFTDQTYTVDGKTLGKYSWQYEYHVPPSYCGPFSPRTVIHETGHGLGLPDYYDYDDTVGPDGGIGGLDMMASNWGDHNSFSKWVLEWLTPTVVASGSQTLILNPSGTSQDAVLIMPGATSSDEFREFFIAQNRYRVGNDPAVDNSLTDRYPTNGMLIWHVDARLNPVGTNYAYDNSYTAHKLLKLIEADGQERIERFKATADAAMYYQPGDEFGPMSTPSSRDYQGVDSGVNVDGISQSWPQMSATFSIDDPRIFPILTVTKAGNGSGTVTSNDGGIFCGNDCQESYEQNHYVTLSAVPAISSEFTGWSGGGCSGTGTCMVSMSEDKTVTATFSTTLVLNEDFSGCDCPSGWERVIIAGEGYWWFNYSDNNTGGQGCYALGAAYGSGPFDIVLKTPTINLAAYNNVELEFKTHIGTSASTADVDVSVDGGSTWTNVWQKVGSFTGPQTVNVDLSLIAGLHSNVMLRFRTYGSSIWFAIDDVKIMASTTI